MSNTTQESLMTFATGNNYVISVAQIREIGSPWTVKVHKRTFLLKRLISSDWFLDESQAKAFAQKLAKQLHDSSYADTLRHRKPGWTLDRPKR